MSPFEAFLASIRHKTAPITTTQSTSTQTTTHNPTTKTVTTSTTSTRTTTSTTTTAQRITTKTARKTTSTTEKYPKTKTELVQDEEVEKTTDQLATSFYPMLASENFSRPFNMLRKSSFLTAEDKGFQVLTTTTIESENESEETTEKDRSFLVKEQATSMPQNDQVQVRQ
jgi:hypothetical protein